MLRTNKETLTQRHTSQPSSSVSVVHGSSQSFLENAALFCSLSFSHLVWFRPLSFLIWIAVVVSSLNELQFDGASR